MNGKNPSMKEAFGTLRRGLNLQPDQYRTLIKNASPGDASAMIYFGNRGQRLLAHLVRYSPSNPVRAAAYNQLVSWAKPNASGIPSPRNIAIQL